METQARHQCLVYAGAPSEQIPPLAAMIQQKLAEGFRCLYMNSAPMVAGLRSRLTEIGLDVEKEVSEKRLVLSSEPPVSEGGDFDSDLMLQQLENALNQAIQDGFKGLWASGDMTWEFGSEKNFVKLMDYENKLEMIFQRRPELQGVCQYHRDTLPVDVPRQALLSHPSIFLNATLSRTNLFYTSPEWGIEERMTSDALLDEMVSELCQQKELEILMAPGPTT